MNVSVMLNTFNSIVTYKSIFVQFYFIVGPRANQHLYSILVATLAEQVLRG